MTTVQLLQRIGRHARGGDFTRLTMSEQGDLVQAADTALQETYNALPIYFKELTQGFVLPAPRTLSLDVTQFSNALSLDMFTDDEIGRTVVIDGDSSWNQIVGRSYLLNPYMGASGTVNATVYGNAVYSTRYPFDRVIGDPKYADSGVYPLFNASMGRSNADPGILLQNTVGRPQCWWVQAMGNSQGNNPVMVMRFAPAPSIAYAINIRLGFWPQRITIADITTGAVIGVPDQFLEKSLIPLAIRALMLTPVFDRTWQDKQDVRDAADRAEIFLRQQPAQQAPMNRVFTPPGY